MMNTFLIQMLVTMPNELHENNYNDRFIKNNLYILQFSYLKN